MPERVATLEADFRSLMFQLRSQSEAHAEVHRDLVQVVKILQANDTGREKREQRLIGGLAVLIVLANIVASVIVPIVERALA